MAIDITTFGTKKARKAIDGVTYNNNPRNQLRYYVQFLTSDIQDTENKIVMNYRVIQNIKQNTIAVPTGEWLANISYVYIYTAVTTTFVDKNGNILATNTDPLYWGTEYEFLLT